MTLTSFQQAATDKAFDMESAPLGPPPPLVAQPHPDALPLSFAQERLWFLDKLGVAKGAYNMSGAVRLVGDLDRAALERSIAVLWRRHESLRTRFEEVDGTPFQVVEPADDYSLEFHDLSTLAESKRAQQVQELTAREANWPFDLARGPLFRAVLLKLAHREHVLLTTMHHIVSDGWSQGVFSMELGELYDAFCQGRKPDLPELEVQPADYALWQRGWLHGRVLEEQLHYWRGQLEGLSTLELPTDRPRPAVASYQGGMLEFDIPAELALPLRKLSRSENATLYMVLLAAFQVLLARYSGQDDITVGSPIAGRSELELDSLIGFFINTLVMRSDLSENPTFRQLLTRVKTTAMGAYAHQDLPFEKIVKELRPERHLAQQPLFQVMFGLHNFPDEPLELSGLAWVPVDTEHKTAIFDLSLHVFDEPQGRMSAMLEYATDLFDEPTIERLAQHWLNLLEAVAKDPDTPIQRLSILGEDENTRLTREWNSTQASYSYEHCVHDLVARQVEHRPNTQAVVFGERALSYDELNRRANQLARYLRSLGVGPDDVVGICVPRSVELIVGVLGILKAGAAYLPLDPSYPQQRLNYMLTDAAPAVVLTLRSTSKQVPTAGVEVVELDALPESLAGFEDTDLSAQQIGADPGNLVYVIYTSGSTGIPKGTAMTHRSMANLIAWQQESIGSAAGTRVLQFAAISFDVAFQEIFSTLCTGGTLVLLDEWVRRDSMALLEVLHREQIARLFVPPLVLQNLAEHITSSEDVPSALQDVIVAGEQLRITDEITALFERLDECRLHNHYGPTETHVATALVLDGKPQEWPALPSIGRPIANARVYVLDKQRQPVPTGVRGEIYLSGAGVARGYRGRQELTARRFLPDPFSADEHSRLYRTGDLGRWRADGTLEYQGRNDDQVKIRGYRIELAEIEEQLAQHPQVREVAVAAREMTAGATSLVAYVTARGENQPSPGELRAHLVKRLPEYMVPRAFVVLKSLPLTPSGKLNRRALPEPDHSAYASQRYEAPKGQVEQELAQMWQGLLLVERVGRQDNFFELGGDSMLAVKLVDRAAKQFTVKLTVASVFRHPTIQQFADEVTALQAAGDSAGTSEPPEFEVGML